MYLPALPTLDQMKAALPIGPWLGDERMRSELVSLGFTSRLINTVLCHSGGDNEYRLLSRELGITSHSEMILGEKGREAVSGMSHPELLNLAFSQRVTMTIAEDRVLRMGDPKMLMMSLLGAGLGEEGSAKDSVIVLVREFITQLFHIIVGMAVMRALPGFPYVAHFVNWAVIKNETVYICSYNVQGNDGKTYPVDANGNRLTAIEAHAAPDTDPRVTARAEMEATLAMHEGGGSADARQAILDDPTITYQI